MFFNKQKNYCQICKSSNIKKFLFDRQKNKVLEELSLNDERIRPVFNDLINRKNGKCKDCGMIQSFNLLNDDLGRLLYKDFGDFDIGGEFQSEYLSEDVDKFLSQKRFKKRNEFYDDYFKDEKFNNVGMLRYWNGCVLEFFKNKFNSNLFGFEFIDSCKKTTKRKLSVTDIEIDYTSRINKIKCPVKLDVLIIFHFLVHSTNIQSDIKKIKSIVKHEGLIIFMDEIMVKKGNPAHMLHFTEDTFSRFLKYHFNDFSRVDGVGEEPKHIKNYTYKNDNPDFIVINK